MLILYDADGVGILTLRLEVLSLGVGIGIGAIWTKMRYSFIHRKHWN